MATIFFSTNFDYSPCRFLLTHKHLSAILYVNIWFKALASKLKFTTHRFVLFSHIFNFLSWSLSLKNSYRKRNIDCS